MNLLSNPFYLLGATPRFGKDKLKSLADDKSLFEDSKSFIDASTILQSPSRRLAAEIRWFCGVDQRQVNSILSYLQNPNGLLSFEPSEFAPLLSLNFYLGVLECERYAETQLQELIVNISDSFIGLENEEIRASINKDRKIADIPLVSDTRAIEAEVARLRLEVDELVQKAMNKLTEASYVRIATGIAEYMEEYDDEVESAIILDDFIDAYTIQFKSALSEIETRITGIAARIEKNYIESRLDKDIKDIVDASRKYDRIAQPIQLAARIRGLDHDESVAIAWQLRGLGIDLYNKHDMTKQSLCIVSLVRELFSEIPAVLEKINEDEKTIKTFLTAEKKNADQHMEMLRHNEANEAYDLYIPSGTVSIPQVCTCCLGTASKKEKVTSTSQSQSGNTTTTRTLSMEFPICDECLKHKADMRKKRHIYSWVTIGIPLILCVVMRMAGSEYSAQFYTSLAVGIALVLLGGLFINLPELDEKHSAREDSVTILPISHIKAGMGFRFTNHAYATRIAEANSEEVTVVQEKRRSRETKFRSGATHPLKTMSNNLLASFMILMALLFVINADWS